MAGQFVVIGLGRFGRNVALTMARMGQSVLAIDADEAEVRAVSSEIDAAVCADASDEAALREMQLERMSCAVVAIGAESMEASILVTALLRQIGVPRIVARSLNELHTRVLLAVGAHEVVNPEAEMGERLARRLGHPNVLEWLELGDKVDLIEVEVPESLVGKTLVEIDVRRRFAVSVVAIRREGRVRATIDGQERLESGDVLLVLGDPGAMERFASLA